MFQRNLLFNEIQSLQINNELEFEVKKKTVSGHVAWAKTILNKILGLSLAVHNKVDEDFKKALARFQFANKLPQTSKLDFQTDRLLLEKNGLFNLTDLDRAKKNIIIQAQTRIEDFTNQALKSGEARIRDEESKIPAMEKLAADEIRRKGKITEEAKIQAEAKRQVRSKLYKVLVTKEFRDPRTLTSLVLHHMAMKRRDKQKQLSNPESYLQTKIHFCIMFDGRILQLHPISRLIYHSNCTSPKSVGVEFEGNFPDDAGAWWDSGTGNDTPTPAQYEAGKFLLSYLNLVIGLKSVLAHRQSSKDRTNDPGPDVWFNVGEWGLANLGLTGGEKTTKCGDGKPIPDSWRKWDQIKKKTASGATSSAGFSPNQETFVLNEVSPKAVQSNRFYGEKLGWNKHIYRINDFLLPFSGLSNVSLGEEAFAAAVAKWQAKNGFSRRDADGVIGPATWRKLGAQLGIAGSTAPRGGSNKQTLLAKINEYDHLIEAASRKHNLPPNVIRAVIAAESGGDRYKRSSANYKGLMQAERTDDQYDPATSIETGTRKFAAFKNSHLVPRLRNFGIDADRLDQKTLLSLVIASYNAGQVTVLKALEYAHRAGDWTKWLEAENYQRALVFSGGYHTYEECTKNETDAAVKEAQKQRAAFSGWRKKGKWQSFPDPPALSELKSTAPRIMMCWVARKHKNTFPYIAKFLQYL